MPKCDKCGYEGNRSEFKYIGQAQETGAMSLRRCPKCAYLVTCDEIAEDEERNFTTVWGMSSLRGKIFKGKKGGKKVNEV